MRHFPLSERADYGEVPPRGDAPRSPGYRPGALLLSYGGERQWSPHQDLHLEPHLLEAGHARVCYTLRAFSMKWLPHMDSHHDKRLNRSSGYFTLEGIV